MVKNVIVALLAGAIAGGSASAGEGNWVSAYYSGWWQGGQLNPEEIDYAAVTHIIHFCLVVGPDGTVNGAGNGITPASAASAVRAAHAGGRKILISVGGSNSDRGFAGAVSSSNREKFIAALVQFMQGYGYDGIDIDWEPVESTSHYMEFIRELRGAMTAAHPGSLLFTAVMTNTDGKLLAEAAHYFDQINLMTYDMSGPWPRWETWHNAPLYNGGARFQSTGSPLPSIDGVVRDKIAAGVPAAHL
ncbi:MAG TPA: glycoside hydrolase family 18 protein, partial [Bacteroidota bacterium]|nr:glycoside hydrolase family 18 protein [Bacteroidota bacterium]